MKSKQIVHFFWILYFICLFVLIYSVIKSGLFYQFDGDELHHAQIIYLILKGFKPHNSFFMIYTPFLHWILMPLFSIFGFSFSTISLARVVMILLFILRAALSYLLIRRVFGKLTAYLFIPLFLLDPFVVFSSMQIRPENLMMVVFTFLLLIFSYTAPGKSKKLYFICGALCVLTLLMSLKIIPSIAAFFFVFIYHSYKRSGISSLLYFLNGVVLSFVVYLLYFFLNGNLLTMFQQVFIDAAAVNNSIRNVTTLNYFYFSNPVVYGYDGKPMSWIYAWSLIPVAFAGVCKAFYDSKNIIKTVLILGFILQWFSMLFINSVFIQYYIPLSWYYSLFAAVLIADLIQNRSVATDVKNIIITLAAVFFILLVRSSILGNLNRANTSGLKYQSEVVSIWQKTKEDKPTFPNILFRPPSYPVIYASVLSKFMLDRYGPIYKSIEANHLENFYQLNDDYFSYLDPGTQAYIVKNFERDKNDSTHWSRK